MKKKRVEEATSSLNNTRIRYNTRHLWDDTPAVITIGWAGNTTNTLQLTLGDLRELWRLHDSSIEAEYSVSEEPEKPVLQPKNIFIENWIKTDIEQKFEEWWQKRGHQLAVTLADEVGETPSGYEGVAIAVKEICLDWNSQQSNSNIVPPKTIREHPTMTGLKCPFCGGELDVDAVFDFIQQDEDTYNAEVSLFCSCATCRKDVHFCDSRAVLA